MSAKHQSASSRISSRIRVSAVENHTGHSFQHVGAVPSSFRNERCGRARNECMVPSHVESVISYSATDIPHHLLGVVGRCRAAAVVFGPETVVARLSPRANQGMVV